MLWLFLIGCFVMLVARYLFMVYVVVVGCPLVLFVVGCFIGCCWSSLVLVVCCLFVVIFVV